jgi:hypothetical protein
MSDRRQTLLHHYSQDGKSVIENKRLSIIRKRIWIFISWKKKKKEASDVENREIMNERDLYSERTSQSQ